MRSFFSNLATRLRRDQRGATAVEYGIMVSLIAVVIIVAVTLLGSNINKTFQDVACSVQGGKTFSATGGADGKGGCV
ncbi:Flp family type IVb pilin [Arthrobacter sp. U41]|uniref:Flp family type IVb pilin n=1 Tax=Arthrobacter sp. U41 TaxID=1849032 RepID=UPI00119CAF47|nr:Flp family type IVb pilin [Arthrobacter sp. U41]